VSMSTDTAGAENYARLLLGWLLLLIVLSAISRTRAGYVIIYYVLVLMIVILVLGSYRRVTDLLGFVRAPGPSSGPSGG
jgi:hypothetical protein